MKETLAVVATMAGMFAAVFAGSAPVTLLMDHANPLYRPLGNLGIALAAVLIVYLWRRFVLRRSWRGVGLGWNARALPQALLGVGAAVAAVGVAAAVTVAVGAGHWQPGLSDHVGAALLAVPTTMLAGQAFPEELLWRGNLYDVLARRLRPGAVIAICAVFFGVLHLASKSGAEGTAQHLLYVVQATALGFLCGAARARTGALWAAIGAHLGLHVGNMLFAVRPTEYGVQLVLMTITMALAGAAFLVRARTRRPGPASGDGPSAYNRQA